jgi:hypothetical protein
VREKTKVSMSSGSSPQVGGLSDGPGTELAVAQQIPVDTGGLWFYEALGETLEQYTTMLFGR